MLMDQGQWGANHVLRVHASDLWTSHSVQWWWGSLMLCSKGKQREFLEDYFELCYKKKVKMGQ